MITPKQSPDDIETIVIKGLDKARSKLLDITRRNRLLNFIHKPNSKILRFVDGLPNQICKKLLGNDDSKSKNILTLSYVPLPKEKDYPEIEDPKDLVDINAKDHAKKLGIPTEWEAQIYTESDAEKKHQDIKLQTLLYPESLDTSVRRISSEAKSAIKETGANRLFLCLGFLKWSEIKNSDVFSYAPLISIPIEIARGKRFADFYVKHNGEDIIDNICLKEKLKQFSITLPSFETFNNNPEEYFSAITDMLKDIKPEWKIQRYITIGFLSFGKMLMYLDLDPKRWPKIGSISDSPHIIDIFKGSNSSNSGVADELYIDSDKKLPKVHLVMDADSSQHSAIIDVLNGKNIVIEGPPGTGKSQTITNLIAACLEKGKKILFVAEKLVALQVVRKRLNSVGLGDFCLELHSHKTQKKVILDDLNKRLKMNTKKYQKASALVEESIRDLNKKKKILGDYSNVMNSPFGEMKLTPHEIFWKTNFFQRELSKGYKQENFTVPKNVMDINDEILGRHIFIIQSLVDKLHDYFPDEHKMSNHFWHGFNLSGHIDYTLQQDIFQKLQILGKAALKAKEALLELKRRGFECKDFANFKKVYSDLDLFVEDEFIDIHLFDTFDSADNVHHALNITSDLLQNYINQQNNYSKLLDSYEIKRDQIECFFESVPVDKIELPIDLKFQELQINLETINNAIITFEERKDLFIEGMGYINLEKEKMSIETLHSVKCVAEICEKIDKSTLYYRNPSIDNAIDNPVLEKLIYDINQLKSNLSDLNQYFDKNNLPSLKRLKEIKLVLDERAWWSFLSPKWRKEIMFLRSFSRNKKETDYNIASAKLDELIKNQISIENLAKNNNYHLILPNLFQGIDTNLIHLKNIISFYKILRENILYLPNGIKICEALKNQDRSIFDWFSKNKDIIRDVFKDLSNVNSLLLAKGEKNNSSSDVSVVLDKFKKTVSDFKIVKKFLDDIKLPMTIDLNLLKKLNKLNLSLKNAASEFEDDTVAKKLNLSLDKDVLETNKNLLDKLHNIAAKATQNLPAVTLPHVLRSEGFNYLQSIKISVSCIFTYLDAQKSLQSHIPNILNFKDFWNTQELNEVVMLNSIVKKLTEIDSNDLSFNKWCDITNSLAKAEKEGMYETIISFMKATDPQVLFSDYVPLYKYLTYNTLSDKVLHQNKILGSFSRFDHENIRNSFKSIDIELQKLNSQMLAHTISRRNIPCGSRGHSPKFYTDKCLIEHEIKKQRGHIPIRQLVTKAYSALIAMKPCFMMGTLSVSRYLDPSNEKFDVLIMDEASQIKPEDAIGILARTNQVVVVGDSNQLPPTNFFEKIVDGGDDEEITPIEDSESILDVCKPLFQPIRRLRWHYRSQHQSLISFSNNHFYDGDLIIFPSPTEHSDSMGVKHIYVGDGIYSNQTNVKEAKHLVDDIMKMIQQYPKRTYGIVTLNSKQKIIIEDLIDSFRKKNSTFDNYMLQTEKTDEDLFVKSIENVQGDERDVIYISVTFGPNDSGVFHQKFGPINGKNGWRRLNVLFTRAKQHIRIFSSFYGQNIRVDDTKEQRGLRALRDYLQFAETGIDNQSHLTEKEPDSDFERAVGSFLIKERYEIVYQLGVAGYFIDIVVKHPENSNYIIAIECDGATYHSAKSARDRDRLREDNLRNLGWGNIHRIWSTDWFKNRETEEKRLLKAVKIAIEANNRSSKIR